MYIYIYTNSNIYIYIYIYRERYSVYTYLRHDREVGAAGSPPEVRRDSRISEYNKI